MGRPGREAVEALLPGLREELDIDCCIVNAENVADYRGITPRLAERIHAAGADAITLGNHAFARDEIGPYLATSQRIVRPANLWSGAPGRGLCVVPARDGTPVAVLNLMGQSTLTVEVSPFAVVDGLVEQAKAQAAVLFVDIHAEMTSEKIAMARWLDGRATAVVGTHTHVQTADARVLAGGTAAMTDAGMCGPHDSVIGIDAHLAIHRMRTGLPVRFQPAEGGVLVQGCVIDCDAQTGRATAIAPLSRPYP